MYEVGKEYNRDKVALHLEEVRNKLEKKAEKVQRIKIQPHKTVYFDKSSNVARRKFKEDYPDNPIIRDMSKADYVIVNKDKFRWIYVNVYDVFIDIERSGKPHSWMRVYAENKVMGPQEVKILNQICEAEAVVEREMILVDDKAVDVRTHFGREMDDDEFKRIQDLMASTDPEMVRLGFTILSSFDYQINELKYVMCLLSCKQLYSLPKTRVFNHIKRDIKQKYVNLKL